MAATPQIPGYRIVRELGKGGMATVYIAIQEKFGRDVAIKIMDKKLLNDPTFSKRFERESQIVAQMNHPHIIQVFDVGLSESNHYLAMELLLGGELNDKLEDGLEVSAAFRIVKEIARALDYAHSKKFIHRDIKPENILFREEGSAVLSDFGIARGVENETQITRLGSVVGTPYYMSPEQASGETLDGRSDLYSLGVVFYKTLTGSIPYDGTSAVDIGIKHIKEPVPKLPTALSELQPLIDRFMSKGREERFQTGLEVVAALEDFERTHTLPRAVIKTEIISTQEVDKIRRSTGQQKINRSAARAAQRQRPSVTKVTTVRPKQRAPVGWLVLGVILAALAGGAALFWMSSRDGAAQVGTPAEGVAGRSSTATSGEPQARSDQTGAAATAGSTVDAVGSVDVYAGRLQAAQALLADGALVAPAGANALQSYRDVLAEAPGETRALRGVQRIADLLAERGERALAADDVAAARQALADARAVRADLPMVKSLQAALDARAADAGDLLQRARAYLAEGALTRPAEACAVDALARLADLGATDDAVAELQSEVLQRLLGVAEEAREFGMLDQARHYAAAARRVDPDAEAPRVLLAAMEDA